MYIPKQKLAQLAREVQSEIRIFYDNPENREILLNHVNAVE
jgi:hypothetical protein